MPSTIGELRQTRTAGVVMIPPFNENGYLPPGIHKASLEEIAERFGRQSEIRRAQMESRAMVG